MDSDFTTQLKTLTPAISVSPAYSIGDQMGAPLTISGVSVDLKESVLLQDVVVVDQSAQSAAFDLLFFRSAPTLASVDNGALSITAAEMHSKFIGKVSVLAEDYSTYSGVSQATVSNCGLSLKPADDTRDLCAVLVCKGTPTYSATSAISIKLKLLQD